MKHTLSTLLTIGFAVIACPLSACNMNFGELPDDYDDPAKAENYYHLDSTYGFEVYAWDRGNSNWRCSIAQQNADYSVKDISVVKELYPVSLTTMRRIIDSYIGFEKNENVIVCIVDFPLTEEGLKKSYRYEKDTWENIDFVRTSIGLNKMFD